MKPLLWIFGNLTIDDIVMPDGTTSMGLCGGNAVYGTLGARFWEERVGLAARVGPDFPDEYLVELREAGIEFALVRVPEPSIRDWALYESTEVRRFVNRVGSGTHLEQSIRPEELPSAIGDALGCHIAPMPLTIQTALVASLATIGTNVIGLDPHEDYIAGHENDLLETLPSVTLFLPSRREAELLYGIDDPEAAAVAFATTGPAAVAVKLGREGSLVCVAGEPPRHVPAVPVSTVDPTGCGDAYCGGFVAAYLCGASPLIAACHGTVSASFTAESRGATNMLPLDTAAANQRLNQLLEAVTTPDDQRSAGQTIRSTPFGGAR